MVSSDWSDTMLDIAVTFFYHPIYMIIALGLVSALQKWASSLESDSSLVKKQLSDLQISNTALVDEVKTLKSQNINLKNEVNQANERSINIKNLYQKLGEDFNKVEKENNELKQAFQVRNP